MFIIAPSARRHGIADEDAVYAATHSIRVHVGEDGFSMFVGPAHDARLLEIGILTEPDRHVIVHAMVARAKFL